MKKKEEEKDSKKKWKANDIYSSDSRDKLHWIYIIMETLLFWFFFNFMKDVYYIIMLNYIMNRYT